ncbi:serine hydrolase domain-containing protein [Pseudochelatococcus sp. B33]
MTDLNDEQRQRIDALIQPLVGEADPGVVLAVLRGGEVVHQAAWGLAELAHGMRLGECSILRIGSQTKQFTTYIALLLEREGKLALDDPLTRHLPWVPAVWADVTLRHLATNTSGIRDMLDLMVLSGVTVLGPVSRDLERRVVASSTGLNVPPGTDLLYSNSNFLLLTDVIEAASGRSFAELLAHYITDPIGMPDTRLHLRDDEIVPGLSGHYRRGPDGAWLRAFSGAAIGGEGGLVSSLRDMVTWQRHLRAPGAVRGGTVARMEAPYRLAGGCSSPYGLGLVRTLYRGLAGIGHGGSVVGARSESVRLPDHDAGVVLLANRDDLPVFALTRRILEVVLGAPARPLLGAPWRERLEGAQGLWRQEDGPHVLDIGAGEGDATMTTTAGRVPLMEADDPQTGDSVVPLMPIPPFALSLPDADTLIATRFANRRIYRRAGAVAPGDPRGSYRGIDLDLAAEVGGEADAPHLVLRSPFGLCSTRLVPCGGDVLLARPHEGTLHDIWRTSPWNSPWLFSLRMGNDGFELASDLTKGVRFVRGR